MLPNLSHPMRKRLFLMAVTTGLLAWKVTLPRQERPSSETGAQNPSPSAPEMSSKKGPSPQASTAKNDTKAEVTIQDSGTSKLRVNLKPGNIW
jgi:hypothetical protein